VLGNPLAQFLEGEGGVSLPIYSVFLPVLNNLGAFAEYSISSGNQHLLYLAESNI